MDAKSHPILLLSCVGILFAIGPKPCQAMVKEFRHTQQEIMKEAQEQIRIEPEATRDIQRKILTQTRDTIEQPTGQPASPLRSMRERIDQLLSKQQVSPEEIDAVRNDLDEVANDPSSRIDRSEHEDLREKLDMAYGFTKAIAELKDSHTSIVDKLNNNFEAVADDDEKVTLWKNIFSGGLTVSFLANMVGIFGFILKVPNAKLERQLKELLILEKRAKLQQEGINIEKFPS